MKTRILQSLPKIFLAFMIITFSSCSNDGMESEVIENSEATIFEFIESQSGSTAARNAPGDDAIALIAINGGFGELVDALSYVDAELNAGLVDLFLNGKDQYTVFAPTDTAFENLYAALSNEETTITDISQLPAGLVLDVLLYHVTEGRRAANSVVPKKNYKTIETLLGVSFNVTPDAEIMAIGNTANIIAANISASNGVIHVIDQVILPIE